MKPCAFRHGSLIEEDTISILGKEHQTYHIYGISNLDYLNLFKKFAFLPQESYKLDQVAYSVLGEKKIDYSEFANLDELYEKDFERFIDYNIKDTNLINRLEKKLGLLQQAFALAYDAKIKFVDVYAPTRMWDSLIHNRLLDDGIVVPSKSFAGQTDQQIEGGYVKERHVGNFRWVVSFDFTSLYPKIIETYNISPDTFVKMISVDGVRNFVDMNRDNSDIIEADLSLCANGSIYKRDKQGFLPRLMAEKFAERDKWKKMMLKAKEDLIKVEEEIKRRNMEMK
jgi:DNA polymerase elongation subunit (family B)